MINLKYPTYTIINGERFDINTSYKIAIECNEIAKDRSICPEEKGLAIIYKIFGDKGLESTDNYEKLLNCALKFLSHGEEVESVEDVELDMDYVKDFALIKTSFRSDFGINLDLEDMHWWEFFDLLNGLSYSEFGNCCILNRIRNLRRMDTSKISDAELKKKIEDSKKYFSLKKDNDTKDRFTDEQKRNIDRFYKEAGIERGDNNG